MKRDKILAVFLTILMVGSAFAFANPAAAQGQGEVNVTLQPTDGEVLPGQEQTYEVVVEDPDAGIEAYDFDLSLDDTNVATFTDAQPDKPNAGQADVTVEDGNVVISHALFGDTYDPADQVTIATVTVQVDQQAEAGASANLNFNSAAVQDTNGNQYGVTTQSGSIAVADQPTDGAAAGAVEVDDFEIANTEEALLNEEVSWSTQNYDDSNNVGPVLGVPVQTGFFDDQPWADDGEFLPTNTVTYDASLTVTANNTEEAAEVVHDYEDAVDLGLALNEEQSTLGGTPFSELDNVEVNNDVGEVRVEIGARDTENEALAFDLELTFEASDPVEGLAIEDEVEDVSVTARGSEGDTANSGLFLAFNSGTTGISAADATNFSDAKSINAAISPADAEPGAYGQFVGAQLSVQTEAPGDTVEIYEADTNDNDEYVLGDPVFSADTSPSNIAPIDTSELGAGEYFIGFNEGDDFADDEFVFLDLRDLNLEASVNDPVSEEETLEIEVDSDESDAIRATGDVQVWVSEAGDDEISDVIHVDRENLLGVTGSATFEIDPSDDLDGEGNYQAVVLHEDSGIIAETGEIEVTEPLEENVNIASPVPADDPYNRGDVFAVELTLENTRQATVTLGDRDANVEINVTVRDANNDGTASFLVNTFQIGDGPVNDGDNGNQDHGIRTTDDGTSVVNIEAHSGLQIGGGSANVSLARPRVVIADGSYDIVASAGETAYKEEGAFATDRSIFRLQQGDIGEVQAWNSPTPGDQRTIADAETVDAIRQGIENGYVTPQDGTMANEDVLVLNIQASGLEGFLLDALEKDEGDLGRESDVIEDFFNREDDDLVTDAFSAAEDVYNANLGFTDTTQRQEDLEEDERNAAELTPASLTTDAEDVLAAADDRGTLNEYFVTIEVNEDNIEDPDDTAEDLPVAWNSTFNLDADIADDEAAGFPLNDFFGDDSVQYLNWDLLQDDVELDGVEEMDGEQVLTVPPRDGSEITGTTEIAAGTTIASETQTVTGEDPPFFFPNEFTVEYVEDAPNTVSFSEDFGGFAGAEFTVDMRRARQPGSLLDGGVNGQVREPANVSVHEFNDQEAGGAVVRVSQVDVNQPGQVLIENADGDVIGSTTIQEGSNADLRFLLDEELEQSQELTSVIVDQNGEEFDENTSSAPVRQTAQYTVGGQTEAFYQVSNLQPLSATVAEGDELTVSATVENVGESAGEQNVELRLDGEAVATEEGVAIESGASQEVSFTVDAPSTGDYTHSIASADDAAQGTLTVEAAGEANFQVDASVDPASAAPGDSATVTGTVTNDGDAEGTQTVTISFDGEEVASEEITLGSGDSQEITADVSAPDSAGDYDAVVESGDGSATATLTVEEETDDTGDDTGGEDDAQGDDGEGPGFGIAAALIALLGAALLAYRRRAN